MIECILKIIQNKEHIIDNAILWQKQNYSNRTREISKCVRDINYVLNSYISDLTNDSINHTTYIGSKFWKEGKRQISDFDVEIQVHTFLVEYIINNITIGSIELNNKLSVLKDIFIEIIKNGSVYANTLLDDAESFQHCQRNWDLTKPISDQTVQWLLDIGYNVPSKQNLDNYEIVCVKDRNIIDMLAQSAQNVDITSLHPNQIKQMRRGRLQNPQVAANILFLFFLKPEGRTNEIRQVREGGQVEDPIDWNIQTSFELGIAAGAIGLSANSVGLKTGFCRCINRELIPQETFDKYNLNKYDLAVILGVGYPLYDQHYLHSDGKFKNNTFKKYYPRKLII